MDLPPLHLSSHGHTQQAMQVQMQCKGRQRQVHSTRYSASTGRHTQQCMGSACSAWAVQCSAVHAVQCMQPLHAFKYKHPRVQGSHTHGPSRCSKPRSSNPRNANVRLQQNLSTFCDTAPKSSKQKKREEAQGSNTQNYSWRMRHLATVKRVTRCQQMEPSKSTPPHLLADNPNP